VSEAPHRQESTDVPDPDGAARESRGEAERIGPVLARAVAELAELREASEARRKEVARLRADVNALDRDRPDVLTIPEAAKLLRFSARTVERWVSEAHVPHARCGLGGHRGVRLSRRALVRWVEAGAPGTRAGKRRRG